MIFATVGTHYFDALVICLDSLAGAGALDDEIVIQIGHGGQYVPRYCRYFRVAPTLEPFERAADLVIGHGGTGTTLEILALGKPLISVANPAMQDNHQHEFLTSLEQRGLVTYCKDLDKLSTFIAAQRKRTSVQLNAGSAFASALSNQLSSLPSTRKKHSGWLTRLAAHWAQKNAIDAAATRRRPRLSEDLWHLVVDPRQPVHSPHQNQVLDGGEEIVGPLHGGTSTLAISRNASPTA
jgi:beta-1,4-N-acetylglucosaminyltransferase